MNIDIADYNNAQENERKEICELLASEILKGLPEVEHKLWHGSPVWFIEGNPIVTYCARKNHIQLLFWSGQSFDEPGLRPEGTFKAAQALYTEAGQINTTDIQKWLKKSKTIQWDYKNIVKRRGELVWLDVK